MKKLLWMLMVPALLLAGGCSNDDDGYSLGDVWRSMATVENPDQENYFYFKTDGGTRLWTAATDLWNYRPKDGQRIIAYFTIISDKPAGSSYDHDVVFRSAYNVLTKNVVEITAENDEELGHDPVRITDGWIGSDYLNVEFTFRGQNKTHYINLGRDASAEYDDGKIHLELRHNAKGDVPSRDMKGIASFNVKSLQLDGAESVTFVIHFTPSEGADEETREVVYKYGIGVQSAVEYEKIFDIDQLVEVK